MTSGLGPERFKVDLAGIVDVFSHHLYSSPRVYLRELVQNAVDAVSARSSTSLEDPRPDVRIVVAADGAIEVNDAGVGLTESQVEDLLATIGSSGKRDEAGRQRDGLLGQFGIGLLACFLVAEEVTVWTRHESGAPLVRWTGSADGTYRLETSSARVTAARSGAPDSAHDWLALGPGTTVRLAPRPDSRRWTSPEAVRELASHYLPLLPHSIELQLVEPGTGTITTEPVAPRLAPWHSARPDLETYAATTLGVDPFAFVPLSVPEAGLSGTAVVTRSSAPAGSHPGHRLYLRGMLMSPDVAGLAPVWAGFCTIVADTTTLRPTASREQLYDDELAELTRRAIGEQLVGWLRRLAVADPDQMAAFLRIHHLSLREAAAHDDAILDLLVPLLPLESTLGTRTLDDLQREASRVFWVDDVDLFRQVAPVAGAQGIVVVNGGYVHDTALLEQWAARHPEARLERIIPRDLDLHLATVSEEIEAGLAEALARAERGLGAVDVSVCVRVFAPHSVAAILLDDREARRARERRRVSEGADEAFGQLLASAEDLVDPRPRLVLNHAHPAVPRTLGLRDEQAASLAIGALYARALLAGRHPVGPADSAVVERSLSGLLDALLAEGGDRR